MMRRNPVNTWRTFLRLIVTGVLVAGLRLTGFGAPGQSFEEAKEHWAYQPVRHPTPPQVKATERLQSPIDAFLLAELEKNELTFAPPADKRTLLRRVYYGLTGLPPTFVEIRAFESDDSAEALAKVLDRLLASPRYGERWGRHWLDVARYADTKDLVLVYGKDALRPFAYTYRDYVIRAFNEDLPYDQFVRDQLAADLIEPKLPPWRLAALGFLTVGRMFDQNPHDQIDDQIDTTTRGLLGLTVACARCHDHIYDAITAKDYYALYGVFASTERPLDLPLIEDPKDVPGGIEFEEKLAKARKELEDHVDAEFAKLTEMLRQRIGDYLVRAATTRPDITETTQFGLSLIPEDFRPTLVQRTRRLIARRAVPDDRIFGPWATLMRLDDEEFPAKLAGMLDRVKQSGATEFNPLVVEALSKATLANKAAVAQAYGQLLRDVYEESKKPPAGSPGLSEDKQELLALVTSPESPIWFPRRDTSEHMSRAEKDKWHGLVMALDKLAVHATNAPPARAMIVTDLPEPYEPHVFRRGNPARLGDAVPRAYLQVLSDGEPKPFIHGSGRLELAHAITSTTNPLTARVLVNRVWMEHFGEPLVNSPADFGTRSDPPTHPELLDWLAAEFMRSGWSLKHLHRVMLLSSAYQQSSRIPHSALRTPRSIDPGNKLLWHYPRRRLDLEAMRDSLLFVSGKLDSTMGGRPVDGASDPQNCRRTVYGLVDRQDLPALYRAFDFAAPDQCVERRPRTTVPQQALFGMNSEFVMEQARALVARPDVTGEPMPARQVDALFKHALGRRATKLETEAAMGFIEAAKADAQPENGLTPWEQFAQVLLISNEAVFLD